MTQETRRLFKPLKLGNAVLQHRIAMAPLTRYRAPNHVPVDRHAVYYGQRATPGGLLITEGTFISPDAGGYYNVPGIWSKEQVEGWKKTTAAVHEKGGIIYVQLWAIGRANKGDADVSRIVSASNLPMPGGKTPEPMSKEEIGSYVNAYRQAAINAIEAGFDGVEIHSANGYLLQQFLEESSNNRTDDYGGPLENRFRFLRETLAAVTSAIGEERTAVRLAPWTTFQGAGQEKDPHVTYGYVLEQIRDAFPKFSYVHVVEDSGAWMGKEIENPRSNDPFRRVFRQPKLRPGKHGELFDDSGSEGASPTVFITVGDYRADSATELVQEKGDVVAIGRYYISNPDLVDRIRNRHEWTKYDRTTFYKELSDDGYIDYATYGRRGHGEEAEERRQRKEAEQAHANL